MERFSPQAQLIAAAGYVVFEPNYRGSDHMGNAFMRAIVKDWGEGPGKDVMGGLEAGADAYIVKSSFDQASLLAAVERVLGAA